MDKPLVFREVAAPDHNPPETDFGSEALERLYLDHRRGLIEAAVGSARSTSRPTTGRMRAPSPMWGT